MPLKLPGKAPSKPATGVRSYYISNPILPEESLAFDPVAINSLGSQAPGKTYGSQRPDKSFGKLPPSDSLRSKRHSQFYVTNSPGFPASEFEEELSSTRETLYPDIPPLNLSRDKTFDQSWQIDSALPQRSNAGKLEDRTGVRRDKRVSSLYSQVSPDRGDLIEGFLNTSKRGSYNTLPHKTESETKENSAGSTFVEIPIKFSALEQPKEMAGKSREPVASSVKRNLKWYCALCLLTILILVVAVIVLAVLGSAKISSLENDVKGTMASETLRSSSALPSTESSALEGATSIEPQLDSKPSSVTLVTPVSETSDTPIRSPTPTSAVEPSLIRQLILSTSSSLPISHVLQTTDIDENLIRGSGYLDQDEDVLPDSILAQDSRLDPREDLEDCKDVTTTITTTLTTTFTSTLRTSKPVISSARSNSVSPQLPEPEPTEARSESVTDTIVHTAGLSTSIISYESDLPDTISSSATADLTLSPGMTPSPTTPPATEASREGTAVISASSSAIARRLVAPLAWNNLRHLRRFLPLVNEYDDETQQNRHVLPSLTVNPTATTTRTDENENSDTTAQPIGTASSNAAVARQALNWISMGKATSALTSKTHNHRQAPSQSPSSLPEGKWTPWQAYSQLRVQAEQMCFSVGTFQNTMLTPVEYQTPEDLQLGEELDQMTCNTLQQTFPAVHQGGQCDAQSEWLSLESKIQEVCALSPAGDKLGMDVEQICNLRKWLVENVDGCGGSWVGSSSSVPPASSGKPTVSTDAESEILSSGKTSSILSISLQQNAMASTNPGPAVSLTEPVSMSGKPLLVTSTSVLHWVSVPLSPTTSEISPTSAIATPNAGIGVVPEHPSLTPPSDWTVSMLTYSTQAASYTSLRTMPSNAAATPPAYTGPHLAKDWTNLYPFPIPTGYVAPNIVPANPQMGQLTYFNPGLGACGLPNMESNELAVAISWELFDMGREIGGSALEEGWRSDGVNPDGTLRNPVDQTSSALCNQGIRAWIGGESGERLVEQEFVVTDRCEGCNVSDLDIQPDVYSEYWDALDNGRIQVTWEWMQEAPTDVPG